MITDLPEGHFEKARLTGQSSADISYSTASRMQKNIINQVWAEWGERIARIPWTPQETQDRLKERYFEDELAAIQAIAKTGSTTCGI